MTRSFESELREILLAHDDEAPTRAVLTVPARRRRLAPMLAAAAVVLMVGTAVALIVHRDRAARPDAIVSSSGGRNGAQASASPLRCPTAEPKAKNPSDLVPALPTVAGSGDRLVPDTTPRSVVVCGWLSGAPVRRTVLTSGIERAVTDLTYAPPPEQFFCEEYLGGNDFDTFLLGITYRSGTVWVAAPGNHCLGSSNGRYSSGLNLGAQALAALDTGTWPTPMRDPACAAPAGRVGQDTRMVPGTPTGLQICITRGTGRTQTTTARTAAPDPALITALNRASTRRSTGGCSGVPSGGPLYRLLFSYARGPDVAVTVYPFCRPSIDNTSVASSDDADVLRVIQRIVTR